MPTWAKVLLIVVGATILLAVVTGVIVFNFMKQQVELMEHAGVEGRAYGLVADIDECAEQGVQRSAQCEGVTCAVQLHSYMWACLENATYDDYYCESVAAVTGDGAMARWAATTCAEYGQPDDEMCRLAMTAVPNFCSYAEANQGA